MNFRSQLIKLTSTSVYAGYLPFIPGTFGSLAGLLFYVLVRNHPLSFALLLALLLFLGFLVCGEAEKVFGMKDARFIVIDEVCGMLISLAFLPHDLWVVLSAFLVFRALDTLKPYPAGPLQRLKGSAGVMMDDIVAGIYTNLVLQLALRIASFKTS